MSDELLNQLDLDGKIYWSSRDAAARIRTQAARIAELEGQSGLDRIAAHNRIAELEAAILGLLEWAQQPDVRATNMSAWIHGVRVSKERSRALGAYWDRAREALRAAEKEALGPVPPPRPRDKEVG